MRRPWKTPWPSTAGGGAEGVREFEIAQPIENTRFAAQRGKDVDAVETPSRGSEQIATVPDSSSTEFPDSLVKEGQLLLAMRFIVGGVEVEGELGRELAAVLVPQPFDPGHRQEFDPAFEGEGIDPVFEAREGGLAGAGAVVRNAAGHELEERVVAEAVVVVAVLVVGEEPVQALAEHLQQSVFGVLPPVGQARG